MALLDTRSSDLYSSRTGHWEWWMSSGRPTNYFSTHVEYCKATTIIPYDKRAVIAYSSIKTPGKKSRVRLKEARR